MSWGAPPPGQNPYYGQQQGPPAGYAQPPRYGQPAGGYAPNPSTQGYGAPAGYRAPPPTTGPYGGVPPQAGGYGGGGRGFGAPFGGQQPGYAPGPPPGVSPDLWQWFQTVDQDHSGSITASELQQALLNGNWTPFNPETCRLMIGMFDRDRNGTIDIHEFAALWKYIQDWKTCFDRFDTDRSGNINSAELRNAFHTFGYNLSINFCQVCMRVFDRQHAQTINFDDFIQCCVMLKSLTDKFRQKDAQQQGVIDVAYEEFLKMVLDT